jgi:type I restriction enzyme S subunit
LFYALRSAKLCQHEITTSIPGLNRDRLLETKIRFPGLSEQKRIAAILDKADAIRRKRQQVIQLADQFLRSVFLEMFGKLLHSSKDSWRELGKETDFIDYRGKSPPKSSSGIPLITARNVRDGYFMDEPREYIAEEEYYSWMTRGFLEENDLLFTTEAPLGNIALLSKYEKVALGQRVIAIRPHKKIRSEFLLYALRHPIIKGDIDGRSTGSTAKGIRSQELTHVTVPIPDHDDQIKFSSIYWKTDAAKKKLENQLQDSENLFSALSQFVFRWNL